MRYAELFCQSNFSFLQGASHPQELVQTAYNLQYTALAITDECSLSGAVRAYKELETIKSTDSKNPEFKLIFGSYFRLHNNIEIVLLAPDKTAYSELCQLISKSRLRAEKGTYITYQSDLVELCKNLIAIWIPNFNEIEIPEEIKKTFSERLYIAINNHLHAEESLKSNRITELARRENISLVATNHVLMHCYSRKPLQDVLNANYHNCTLDNLGYRIEQNAERYLRSLGDIQSLHSKESIDNTNLIAKQCTFCLSELSYEYPSEVIPQESNASSYLKKLVQIGRAARWPQGPEKRIDEIINKELAIIAELQYEHYFLTIYDIVQFARENHILYQGRGSAANSVVCYCLFITEIDPHKIGLLFERFISRERNEPPDIDVDFEHERREEVIQYIYTKYSRERAGLTASKITYRFKSAVRDIGKALGINAATIEQLIAERAWWDTLDSFPQQMQKVGIDPSSAIGKMFPQLLQQIYGFPRHLSQHVGGFVITEQPLYQLVPIENAAMEDRTLIQWDKEDIEDLKLMKVDVLALGMLTALRKSLNYIALYGPKLRLQDIPAEDPQVYEMMCKADTVGVFQIESRAQMSMLPRLQPRNFYELTIEIAIVRPGPIQGGMVHPYLKRKQGLETVRYPHNSLRPVLERTLGVPIFQEQVIQLSMVAAGFSGGEADELRRAMASWGKNGDLYRFRDKLVRGMQSNGYRESFAEQLFNQMKGFGSYGFPESHSASFALLAYFSAWIKYHHPAAFYCGLLNSQPMGFYAPAQLVYDAQRHGVKVLPIDILHSHWNHRLEPGKVSVSQQLHTGYKDFSASTSISTNSDKESGFSAELPALRLGMRLVKGLKETTANVVKRERKEIGIHSLAQMQKNTGMSSEQLACLANANVFHHFTQSTQQGYWLTINNHQDSNYNSLKPLITIQSSVEQNYNAIGLTLNEHPIALLRRRRRFQHCTNAKNISTIQNNHPISVIGIVTCRQKPGTASGVMFLTLEDETGTINIVIWKTVQAKFKAALINGRALWVTGVAEHNVAKNNKATTVSHVIAKKIVAVEIEPRQ